MLQNYSHCHFQRFKNIATNVDATIMRANSTSSKARLAEIYKNPEI